VTGANLEKFLERVLNSDVQYTNLKTGIALHPTPSPLHPTPQTLNPEPPNPRGGDLSWMRVRRGTCYRRKEARGGKHSWWLDCSTV